MLNQNEFLNKILCGDSLTIFRQMPSESIDLIITSPPYYGLRRYGDYKEQIGLESSFKEFLDKIMLIMAEIKRVVKKEGQIWINFGDCYASEGKLGGDFGKDGKMTKGLSGRSRTDEVQAKCMMMMPERFAIRCIDELGLILRNKIKWAKQVLDYKQMRTKGSVMPTSVKDRFNESGEELYFFVKNKKYYSDLDAVRLPNQVMGISDFRNPSTLSHSYFKDNNFIYNSKYKNQNSTKFNYRVRDAKRKAGQPQFKASEKEIKRYNEIPEDYGKKKLQSLEDKGKGLNRWMSGTPNYTYQPNKVNDPRGNHEGGPGSWRDFKDNPKNSYDKHIKSKKVFQIYGDDLKGSRRSRIRDFQDNKTPLLNNIAGKNLPTVWLIGSEPHNFSREFDAETDHFATFPEAICEIPIKFGCPKNGIVLDPFAGSGTALLVAQKLGRNYIGVELNSSYCEIAKKRLAQQVLI